MVMLSNKIQACPPTSGAGPLLSPCLGRRHALTDGARLSLAEAGERQRDLPGAAWRRAQVGTGATNVP